ncbi:NAD(P)-dependent oxidoreductase [Sphingobacteriaceae bacterium]|nr:NAD(P)-dependent oxidoreductase [Sphingobacteriaceae bacterium]
MSKIFITGVTGHFGKATLNFLLNKGISASDITVLVREEAKAEEFLKQGLAVKQADYSNYEALVKAFKGSDTLLLVSGTDIPNRSQQQENVVKAAKEAGVKRIVYTSFDRKNETSTSPIAMIAESHLHTEKAIKASGLQYTILRNNLYMDMLPMFIGDKAVETGVIYQPSGDGKAAYLLREDMAEIAANVLINTGHENKEYVVGGATAYSYAEIAELISELTGKTMQHVSPSKEEYIKTLTEANVPTEFVHVFAGFADAKKQGELDTVGTETETLLGRKATSMKAFLTGVYSAN